MRVMAKIKGGSSTSYYATFVVNIKSWKMKESEVVTED